ncbi:MAG TPA: alkaline phosphatase [Opitutae bacterium]|nr:alkaline phosphatase [Opitutae bacterium]
MHRTPAILTVIATLVGSLKAYHPTNFDNRLEVIAFGSCNRQHLPQPLWPVIASHKPDLWIWAGDNIYGDSEDPKIIEQRYAIQLANPNYAAFRTQHPIVGTWDDHDYGWNDANKDYPIKHLTQQMALDFMDVPSNDPRRSREGIYGSYDFGPEGQRVKVILLDGRYFSTGKQATSLELLGDEQKNWLKKELENSTAQIHLFVSGIQILSEDHRWDSWARYPADREWLLSQIAENKIPGAIILSGDRHIHEFSVLEDERIGYPLLDATSSGLTHSWKKFKREPNRHRVGEVHKDLGFGLLTLDWSESSCKVTVQICDLENQPVNELIVNFNN